MILSNMTNKTKVDDDLAEVLDADFDSYVLNPWTWVDPDGGTPHYVFILPIVAFIALVCNILIITVFVKQKMMSTTNIIMTGIAISDTLTVMSPTPLLIYIYGSGHAHIIPFDLCVYWEYLMKNICSVTHTASIWLTMYLGINRYLGVCHPFVMRRRCNTKTTVETIFFIYVLSVLFHLCRFIDTKYVPEYTGSNVTNITCSARHADWLNDREKLYECIYHWCHIVCICVIPCATLVILDTIMLRQIRKSETQRSVYLSKNQSVINKSRHRESIRTTKIIVTILAMVCLLELSLGTLLVLWTLSMMGFMTIPEKYLGFASTLVNFCIYISYPFIFFLYCWLSTRFRRGMCQVFRLNTYLRKKSVEMSLIAKSK